MLKKARVKSLKKGDEVFIVSEDYKFFASGEVVETNVEEKRVLVKFTGFDTDKFDVKSLFHGNTPSRRNCNIGDNGLYGEKIVYTYYDPKVEKIVVQEAQPLEIKNGRSVIVASKKWGFLAQGKITKFRQWTGGKVIWVLIQSFDTKGLDVKAIIDKNFPDNSKLEIGKEHQFGEKEIFVIVEDKPESK